MHFLYAQRVGASAVGAVEQYKVQSAERGGSADCSRPLAGHRGRSFVDEALSLKTTR